MSIVKWYILRKNEKEKGDVMNCEFHSKTPSCVGNVPIFKDLNDEEISIIEEVIKHQKSRKGEFIFQEGEPSNVLYVVHSGLIKISKLSDEGKEQIIRLLFPGDFFGQYALLEDKLHNTNAEVLEDTSVCRIHREDFRAILERNPTIAMKYMLVLSERLEFADEWMGAISLMEVERRLAKALLLFYEKELTLEFELPVSKKDFASFIGTTPETLSRKLVSLQSSGLLELKGRKGIKLASIDEIREIANY
jgi:CRP-like cAMP-binding protein